MDAPQISAPASSEQASPQQRFVSLARRRRLVRMASVLELYFYVLIGIGFILRRFYYEKYDNPILLMTSPETLAMLAFIFFGAFSLILTGATPIVSGIMRNRRLAGTDRQFDAPMPESRTQQPSDSDEDDGLSLKANLDPVERTFAAYISRSQTAVRFAQRRPNALLFVGTSVAVAGLIFFVLTLPGSRYLFIDITPSTTDLKADLWSSMLQLLPRLLMLIFIQVLAGFFLRQYRSSLEDFRYYESVLRYREAQYLSYTLRREMGDQKALLKFADEILKQREFGQLGKGQTTIALEAQRSELNEFGTLYEKFASLFARAEKATKAKPPG
jgi:hypothetical protein